MGVDIATILFTAAVTVVEKVIIEFIKQKIKKASVEEIDKKTQAVVKTVSAEKNVDEKILLQESEQLIGYVIDTVPGFKISGLKTRVVHIPCGTPQKSALLISNMKKAIYEREMALFHTTIDIDSALESHGTDNNTNETGNEDRPIVYDNDRDNNIIIQSKSEQMLNDMKSRITLREMNRR